MPPINWDKYGLIGEGLDSLHKQQQSWPGSAPYSTNKGREHAIAAPYSPWLDNLDAQNIHIDGPRKDSGAPPNVLPARAPSVSATGTISEHPMETRSRH